MSVSLIVPVTLDGLERERNWSWLRPKYEQTGWEIVECWYDPKKAEQDEEWSKGRAVNPGVEHSSGDVLVIADADLFIDRDVLDDAIERVERGAPWVMPHGVVYRLSRRASSAVCAYPSTPKCERTVSRRHDGPVGGGFVVCSRTAFDTVRGIDPRFTGWGGEDISFGRALDTLVGTHVRLWAPTWHLWHTPMPRHLGWRASPENEQLANRYLDAAGDPIAMRAIVEEHDG